VWSSVKAYTLRPSTGCRLESRTVPRTTPEP
jgi:hypothetical protein